MEKKTCAFRIRSRTNFATKTKQEKHKLLLPNLSKQFGKQFTSKVSQQIYNLPALMTESLPKSKPIHVPYLFIESNQRKIAKLHQSQRTAQFPKEKAENERIGNAFNVHRSKSSFKVRKISIGPLALKNNSSILASDQNSLTSNHDVSIKQRCKTNLHQSNQINTNFCLKTSTVRRYKDQKCLIAGSRRLPFSLDRQSSKRKETQKTNFTCLKEQFFDLDISVILDEHEGPDTPFIRQRSLKKLQILPQIC